MRILVDIGHPAHVHLFKNTIWEMEKRGHQVKITARAKDVSLKLLEAYNFDYQIRSPVHKKVIAKMVGMIKTDLNLLSIARKFNPDVLIGVHNPYVAHVGKLLNKKVIIFTDTEHAKLASHLTFPFSDLICTPSCFKLDLGQKHRRYNGYHELAYLHPKYFTPDPSILNELGLTVGEKFAILRFVEWSANHDIGHTGIPLDSKISFCKELSQLCKIFITSEVELPTQLEEYRVRVKPEKIHNLMYYSSLLIGESATMASESAIMGIPSIFIDFIGRGYTDEEETEYGLVFNFKNNEKSLFSALNKAKEILTTEDMDKIFLQRRNELIADKIDVTEYMIQTIESFELN